MRLLWLILVTCCLVKLALGWRVDNLPDPRRDFRACGRKVKGWVCSPNSLVADHKLDVVQGDINAIYAGEDPYSKVFCDVTQRDTSIELLAVVIDKVDGYGDASTRVAAFTRGIHNRFGVGSAACGSGAIIVVSVDDRQVQISTGQLIKQHLSSQRIQALVDGIKPQLRNYQYGQALEKLVVEVGLELSSKAHHDGGGGTDDQGWWLLWILVPVLAFCTCVWCKERESEESERRAVTEQLRRLQKDSERAQQGAYVSTSCPICLEDFTPLGDNSYSSPEATSGLPSSQTSPAPSAPPLPASNSQYEPLLPAKQKQQLEYDRILAVGGGAVQPQPLAPGAQVGYFPALMPNAGGGASLDPPKLPFVLPCGHTFCEDCIMDWLSRSSECPMCRQPAPGGRAAALPLQAQQTAQNYSAGVNQASSLNAFQFGNGLGYDLYDYELEYRLNRIRARNSRYITEDIVNDLLWQERMASRYQGRWGHRQHPRGHHHRVDDWGRHPLFLQQVSQPAQAAHASDGHHGSRVGMSSGGGHSSGGGGGGW